MMGVPRHFPTSTKNSTRVSYDNAYIQKIPAKTDVTPKPIARTFKPTPHYRNRTNERTDSYSDRDKDDIHKRFQELFNNTYPLNSDFPWLSSTNVTNDYSSLYEIPLPKKIHVVFVNTPTWKYYLSAPTIIGFVLVVLKIFVCYQRVSRWFPEEQETANVLDIDDTDQQQTNESSPPPSPSLGPISISPIIIDPEFSSQNNSLSDLPPSYSQCAVNNVEAGNKNVDNTSEDVPPPYSICIGTLNATGDIPKTHKRQSVEEQSCTETDIHIDNLRTTDSNK